MTSLSAVNARLGKAGASHLLRRATFGPGSNDIEKFARLTPAQAVNELMRMQPDMPPPLDLKTSRPWLPARSSQNSPESRLRFHMIQSWLHHMCSSPLCLSERMVYFYHTHFTTMHSRVNYGSGVYYQNVLFRHYALGNFKELAYKICYDQAMLMNLDGRYNRRENPNENFAREFLELYSIGKGDQKGPGDYTTYTEDDIKQATRILSGFQIDESFSAEKDRETGIPMGVMPAYPNGEPTLHDFGSKTFSEKFGRRTITPEGRTRQAVLDEIREFVNMVFDQEATARHICRKLYRFFVFYRITPEVERNVIEPLARTFIKNNYEVRPVLKELLCSKHFYDAEGKADKLRVQGAIIKSPLEMLTQAVRYFDAWLPEPGDVENFYFIYSLLFSRMQQQGMELYEPPEVAGYPAYHQAPYFQRNWISSSTLMYRQQIMANLVEGIFTSNKQQSVCLDVLKYVERSGKVADPGDARLIVERLTEDLLARPVRQNVFDYLLHEVLMDNLSFENWRMEWKLYQQSGKDYAVRKQLEKLLISIVQLPEYQLY
ncbi:MAG: DUF1800 family protein [Cyclobacteriaceae bacterium]